MRGRQLLDVAGGVAWRQLHNAILNPTIFIPSLAFPLLNFASFAGGLLVLHQQALGQQIFAPIESLRALTMVVVGGFFPKTSEWP